MLNFLRPVTITYGITVCNEHKELKTLLDVLIPLIDKNDEILVLRDMTNPDQQVGNVLKSYQPTIKVIEAKLGGNFAAFKNNLIHHAKSRYLFQIDADEYPNEELIRTLKLYLRKKRKVECFLVPRINIVEGITEEYVNQMNWNKNEAGYINFPDYQPRIIKNNKHIFWKNKVHETLYGYRKIIEMPKDYNLCLMHIKDFDRQRKQNEFYETLN